MRAAIIPARAVHIPHLAAHMRPADAAECWAWALAQPAEALAVSLAASAAAWTGTLDGRPACMFGVTPRADGAGVPWLLGTVTLQHAPRTMARLSLGALERIRAVFPRLENWSDARNTGSHAWLWWLGFKLEPPAPAGALGLPFRRFHMGSSEL